MSGDTGLGASVPSVVITTEVEQRVSEPEASGVTARGESIGVPQGRVPRITTDQYACQWRVAQQTAVACLLYNTTENSTLCAVM
jgi:hypothetical protein